MSTSIFMASLILLTLTLVQTLTPKPEIEALKAFRASIAPSSIPPWSCLASWDFSGDPCALPRRTLFTCGLNCAGDSVSGIVLDPVGYSGTLNALISQLSGLKIIDLADNSFSGQIPPAIAMLKSLETLTLRSNSFSGPIPGPIMGMGSLRSLDFSRNSLTGTIPAGDRLTGLSRIDLSFNRFTGSIPVLPPNLLELAIKGNSLSGSVSESAFSGLNRLEVVELGSNRLSGSVGSWFLLLPAIQQVDLANNSLTRIEIKKPNSSNLIAVDFSFNRIAGNLAGEFAGFPVLSSLSLRKNRLHGAIPGAIARKGSLRRLFLDGNFLAGTPAPEFFSGEGLAAGSFGDNCLRGCPASSRLCATAQKPGAVCRRAYGGKWRP